MGDARQDLVQTCKSRCWLIQYAATLKKQKVEKFYWICTSVACCCVCELIRNTTYNLKSHLPPSLPLSLSLSLSHIFVMMVVVVVVG